VPHEAECPCEFCEIFRLRARIAELEEWKSSALDILNGINLQEVGKALSVGLGQPIGPAILPGIHSLRARVAELEVDTTRRLGSRVNVLEDALEEIAGCTPDNACTEMCAEIATEALKCS